MKVFWKNLTEKVDIVLFAVQRRIEPDAALGFGVTLAAMAVVIQGLAVNILSATVLAVSILFYVFVYTVWLKRRTPQNIVIGGAAGAFPPIIGWAAATGTIDPAPIVMFLLVFLWTPPHFWALALYKNGDYAKAGVPMMPVVKGARATKQLMIDYTIALWGCTLLLHFIGFAGNFYYAVSGVLGAVFFYHVVRVRYDKTDRWAKKTFGFSIIYLFMLFTAMMIDSLL